jgi:hypothetical protein
MAVNNENQHEQGDYRSRPSEPGVRVSGKRVLRLLRRKDSWRRSGSVAAATRGRMTA